ncbi:MAG: BlaI/MecI/CopY family transcriptional regulator [Thermoleophilaceae bacterium]|nr:BlaI/MecI/CopY family transcriptional regulator [Thermoleophilaceae bacterium]
MGAARKGNLELRGDLQSQIMAIVWRLGEATVEDVRAQQPGRRRSAYTTVQTVMNRLSGRGLLSRSRQGRAIVYRAAFAEPEYLARAIGERLADASRETRQATLVSLVDGLDPEDLGELARYTNKIRRARRSE